MLLYIFNYVYSIESTLEDMFPDVSTMDVETTLLSVDGDVGRAVEILLEKQSKQLYTCMLYDSHIIFFMHIICYW